MRNQISYADVLLPLPLNNLYTYSIDDQQKNILSPGCRVIVQFGIRKYYTALVISIHDRKPENYRIKPIYSVLDIKPVVNSFQLDFWKWIAVYYMCSLGEVFKSALPSSLKPESETMVIPLWDGEKELNLTKDEEFIVTALIKNGGMSLKQLELLTGRKKLMPVINTFIERGIAALEEHLLDKYKPRMKAFVKLNALYNRKKELNKLIDKLEKTPGQLNLLMNFLQFTSSDIPGTDAGVEKSALLKTAMVSESVLTSMVRKKILETYQKEVGRLQTSTTGQGELNLLTVAQHLALDEIKKSLNEKDVVLLHGVTSSGKTEIYIHLIEEQLKKEKQVLYLLPEIALTSQIIKRLKNVYGNRVGIYHSRFSNAERVEVYRNISGPPVKGEKRFQVIVGVRSSIFLPFNNLGLVIVDEEHDSSYKQVDPAPRYHARDAAIMLARFHGAKTLLGSATPSVESYYNSETGKYKRVELNERYLKLELPEIVVVDIKKAAKKKQMQSHFSSELIRAMTDALDHNEQVILFQNRRGFSPYLACSQCGWVPVCKHCDVSLVYHKQSNRLVCHYCGYQIKNLKSCPSCGNSSLLARGFGTEKVEDEIKLLFPGKQVARLDLDNAKTKKSYTTILEKFESGEINILVGTQMISKGLDFNHVKVVGILNADSMLNFPDFRSHERSFQLMTQVGGRAGRRNGRGKVIIQTYDPDNTVISNIVANNYRKMFREQIDERKEFRYPPFYRLIYIILKHRDASQLDMAAEKLAVILQSNFGDHISGPQFPLIGRIQDLQIRNFLLRLKKDNQLEEKKLILKQLLDEFLSTGKYSQLHIVLDADPV
ncbi:MAG: primosomal protein N' [Bacteroidales bacterium]|nr:primosomal protein N' [Bacteroidales bacterium]